MRERIALSTGRICTLEHPALPFLAHYHVLSLPGEQGPASPAEEEEILHIAARRARALGRIYFRDEQCFSLVYNGRCTRRRPWLHVHILLARSPAMKRLAFLAFFFKRLLRRLSRQRPVHGARRDDS